MKSQPLAKSADVAQVERCREFLEGRNCAVVGSAPLPTRYAELRPYETTIAVNGGISSLPAIADLWVVTSKAQDQSDGQMRPLHRTMLEQAKHRMVGHVLFLRGPKIPSEHWTMAALTRMDCRYGTYSLLDKPTKRWLEGEFCARADDKKPCSSGILAAAIALYCGAASVRLVGISLKAGYQYLPKQKPESWWRDHIAADTRALKALQDRYGERLLLPRDLFFAVAA